MNIQQFQYIVALAENRHFVKASEQCFISQSTLSTMISKFEDEIGLKIFDRSKKPVELTSEGERILEQIKMIQREIGQLEEMTKEIKGEVKGTLSIAVPPTIAPFLLPLFLQSFAKKFPNLSIQVKEQTTGEILRQLSSRELDIGIVSTPLVQKDVVEYPLYHEPFMFYNAGEERQDQLTADSMDVSNLCLLEEGHCMRTQVVNLCDLHKLNLRSTFNFDYKAGSIDSLLRFVKANKASTLLPFLATLEMSEEERERLSAFAKPVPFRTIGLAVHKHFVKHKILEVMKESILKEVSQVLPNGEPKGEQLLPI